MGSFESNMGTVHGHMTAVASDPHGQAPANVINLKQDWHLQVDWSLHGAVVPMLDGKWQVTAYLESIGPGPEIVVASDTVDIGSGGTPDPFGLAYTKTFFIGPNNPPNAGVYKLVTVINSISNSGTPGPFAAFEEGPVLQFYVAP